MDSEQHKIICNGYPPEFILDKNLAKEYFKQFGRLKRVTFKPKLRICTIEYADREGYLKALNNAGEYNGNTFNVSSSSEMLKSKEKPDSVWVDKGEIEAELAAMSGYAPKSYKPVEDTTSPPHDSSKFEKVPKLRRAWKNGNINKVKNIVKSKENWNTRISGEEVELVNLVLSQAITNDDKYKILDARDKLLKIKLKRFPLEKSAATVGTCPDMCPEKERLFRESKHQVAWYEQDDNGRCMNHNRAVKQYSRSSADQEAPLAHELRPVSVLQMTMGYLLHNIVDLCDTDEVHLGEWFHFLWDRTRGIRKDITQQALCSQGAVELVEQCARFHIHCSARLVAEDPSVFDQKINTENLTKCLQTLKYMYNDLLLKGERCEHEAEFRAYIILLNLNDGNFMWEVQQLPQEIQRSEEVRFAMQVYSALDKNNYVQFFKLVYSTTYLNACILMRYFVQVRITAVKTLLKCYIPRTAKTSYPLVELQSNLAFDDIDSTIDMIHYCGISINEDRTHVILDKNNSVAPEFPYSLDRSMIIEDKRSFPVGRIICAEELPPKTYLTHKIQQSFDKNGFLIDKDILDDLDLEKVKLKLLEELNQSKDRVLSESEMKEEKINHFSVIRHKAKPDPFGKEQNISNPNPFALGNKQQFGKPGSIFSNVESLSSKNIFVPQFTVQSPIPLASTQFSVSSQTKTDSITKNEKLLPDILHSEPKSDQPKKSDYFTLFQPQHNIQPIEAIPSIESQLSSIVPKIAQQEDLEDTQQKLKEKGLKLIEEQKELDFKKRQEQKRLYFEKQEQERLIESKKKIEMEKEREQNRLAEAKIEAEKKKRELLKLEREEELQKRLEALQKEKADMRKKEMNDVVKNVVSRLITQVDNEIRNEKLTVLKENIERKILSKTLSQWRLNVSKKRRKRKAIDCSPVWINTKSLGESAEELHTSSQKSTLTLMKRYKYGKASDIRELIVEKTDTINLYHLTYSILKNRTFEQSTNKPNNIFWKVVISLPNDSELNKGLRRIERTVNNAFPWRKCNERILLIEQVKPNSSESVTYCIEKQQGYDVKQYDSNGIIFVAENFNSNLQRRIFENLKGFGVYTKVPIVIILQDYKHGDCELEKLIEENIVSDYNVIVENASAPKMVNAFEEGLVFLAKKVESSPPLELDGLRSFMKKYLCSEIWKRANSFAKWNSIYRKCLQNPNVVLDLYNEGLKKLKYIILNESNEEYAVFPEEFKKYLRSETPDFFPCSYRYFPKFWKNKKYSNKLELILDKLSLPKWSDIWPPRNEYELEVNILKYCSKITKNSEKLFFRVMSLLLRKVDPNFNFQDIANVLWTDVIELLSLEKLNSVEIILDNEFKPETIFEEYFVVYNVDKIEDYRFCDWFYINNPQIKKCIEDVLEQAAIVDGKSTDEDVDDNLRIGDDFIASLRDSDLSNKPEKYKMLRELSELERSLNCLTENMAVHRKISSKLNEGLTRAIAEK